MGDYHRLIKIKLNGMILTKINIDELKLAESDITRSVYAMLPQELKDEVKDHAQNND